MSVYAAGGSRYALSSTLSRPKERPSPLERARQMLAARIARQTAALSRRAAQRLAVSLSPAWQIVDWPHVAPAAGEEHPGFLAIGPSGVFAVSVLNQGRQRVLIAGEVIQIRKWREPHVARARRFAKRVRKALSAAIGVRVPVVPVITFVGTGPISAHGLPAGCITVNLKELPRVLASAGDRITPETARKLAEVAKHPDTWAIFS